ncbi:MAG: hypothetical protein Hyperionvirus18_29 [Hyperionvirus sp.]|uniref:C3H1-type domain-containing protein n=1 Tax=Hyperionvirus sp. TaxID=2487770 RepID=A0A3G5AE50_9VIRU|nr:MAG: hypothetical protein Hyperionvirus18_29 [Hyperionvirus sp.]
MSEKQYQSGWKDKRPSRSRSRRRSPSGSRSPTTSRSPSGSRSRSRRRSGSRGRHRSYRSYSRLRSIPRDRRDRSDDRREVRKPVAAAAVAPAAPPAPVAPREEKKAHVVILRPNPVKKNKIKKGDKISPNLIAGIGWCGTCVSGKCNNPHKHLCGFRKECKNLFCNTATLIIKKGKFPTNCSFFHPKPDIITKMFKNKNSYFTKACPQGFNRPLECTDGKGCNFAHSFGEARCHNCGANHFVGDCLMGR